MKIKKDGFDSNAFFMRRFPAYRELEKTVRHKDDALRLAEAVIQTDRNDIATLQKKIVSDSNLIESLNRYIETLEGKMAMQAEMIQELKDHLCGITSQKTAQPQ